MLTSRVIPCLDVMNGRVVKGVRFTALRDAGDPAELARDYEQQGADEIVLLDVSATPEGRAASATVVERVRAAIALPLCVGGGVRSADAARRLLAAGADKVAVNTAAVERPAIVAELASLFGSQCVVASIDAAKRPAPPAAQSPWEVVIRSGSQRTGLDAVAWAAQMQRAGAGEILLTSWDRDGSRSGYDLACIAAVRRAVALPIIASGGASSAADMLDALRAGADAVLAASILHDGDATVAGIKRALAEGGAEIRT